MEGDLIHRSFLQNSAFSMDNFCIGGSNELSNTELVKIIVKLLNDKLGLNINLEKAIGIIVFKTLQNEEKGGSYQLVGFYSTRCIKKTGESSLV